ncbi:hypothetical protein AB4876_18785 [Zhongshania guokunii]|uniref:DUF4145 domain-containing protein n=1 Tax=Zhongshania guokunii TaxID=641783 RepID=A0ABV3UAH0_9GAMM
MAIESPLFQSAMELFGHSLSHYIGKKELDRKLVILHLANAIELILKDLVLDSGESIYKNPKETITIQGCLSALEKHNIKVPYLNKIELLIDERNALQHRFGSPNELTSIFYMNIAQDFFKQVLKMHYGQEYGEIISQFAEEQDLATYNLSNPSNDQELEKLQELSKIHPLGAFLSAWSYFEKMTEDFMSESGLDFGRRRPFMMELTRGRLAHYGIALPEPLLFKIQAMRHLRNMSAHGRSEPTKDDVIEAIETIEELERFLESLSKNDISERARPDKEEYEKTQREYQAERESMNERHQRMMEFDKTDG